MEERIKEIYNACWHNYKLYLTDHDMAAYNKRSGDLVKKFGAEYDIQNLLFWFVPLVNSIHDKWRKEHG